MNATNLETALREFDRVATLVDDRPARQVWRFEFSGRNYQVHFFPRDVHGVVGRVNPALREFTNLQELQRAKIPSPHAVAQLAGFRIRQRAGDAIILQDIDGATPLDQLLRCTPSLTARERRGIVAQVIQLLKSIGQRNLGHRELSPACFLVAGQKVYFGAAEGLRRGGLRTGDLLTLAHHASSIATRTELLRGWRELAGNAPPPDLGRTTLRIARRLVRQSKQENDEFGRLEIDAWRGHFVKRAPSVVPWSLASRLHVTRTDWQTIWPTLMAQVHSGQFDTIKSDPSGDVLAGQIVLAGRPLSVFIKRPRRKFWFRYLLDLFRPARAMRTWQKAWLATCLNLPCEFPLLVMERKVLGYAMDGVVVFEHVPGQQLDQIDLSQFSQADRERLFCRLGRIQRRIEQAGLAHYDSKSTNWIIHIDPRQGPMPVMIDVDGIRRLNRELRAWGIRRLLRALRQHPQYTPSDSLTLCRGYAPYSPVAADETAPTS